MHCSYKSLWRCAGIVLVVLSLTEGVYVQGTWTVTDLGTLEGATSWGAGVNDLGQAVGSAETSSGRRAFRGPRRTG